MRCQAELSMPRVTSASRLCAGPMSSTPIIERIEDAGALEGLRQEWTELLEASASDCLFLTWEWLSRWWLHLAEGRRLFVVTVRSGGELVAVAPLALLRRRIAGLLPLRSLEFLGTGYVGSDYLDIIVRRGHESAVIPALAEYLTRTGIMLDLSRVDRSSRPAEALRQRLHGRGWALAETTIETCPYIDLRGRSWQSYLGSLGREHRYNIHRRLRNASRAFALSFEQARSEDERREALAVLLRLHDLRWGPRSDAFHTPELRAFHDDVSRLALARGWLRLFLLRLDGVPVAALYGFRYRERFYFYQSGFDPAYAKRSVGLITTALAIKTAIEEGIEEYDLLHGDEPYKLHWASQARALMRLELYPPTVRDGIRRHARSAMRSARRLARRMLPESVVGRIATAQRIGVRRASAVGRR